MDGDSQTVRREPLLARLHALPDWRFTLTLYLLRWVVIVPLALALSPFATAGDAFQAKHSPEAYLLPFLVFAPVMETLIECLLPYLIMVKLLGLKLRSPWPFVVVSASVMVLLHPLLPVVMVMASITGAFLAYVYIHFAPNSLGKAFLHTAVFHAGINAVGWTMILVDNLQS